MTHCYCRSVDPQHRSGCYSATPCALMGYGPQSVGVIAEHVCGTPDAMCDAECMEKAYAPPAGSTSLVGRCFKVETSYGDGGPSWWVYRRVRKTIAGYAECHRFETRSDGMRAMYPADPIRTDMLLQQEEITDEHVWGYWWERWLAEVSEPWSVE